MQAESSRSTLVLLLLLNISLSINVPINPFEEKQHPLKGRVCAFGDFNGDRMTDIIYQNGTKLEVIFQGDNGIFPSDKKPIGEFHPLSFEVGKEEVECSLGDLNGDGFLDVVVSKQISSGKWEVDVFFRTGFIDEPQTETFHRARAEPFHASHQVAAIDVNGDGIHDLLGIDKEGKLLCLLGDASSLPFEKNCSLRLGKEVKLHDEMPIFYSDVTGDVISELIFPVVKDRRLDLMVLRRKEEGDDWEEMPPLPPSKDFSHALAPVIGDFNQDGLIEIGVPVCKTADCSEISTIFAVSWGDESWGEWIPYSVEMQSTAFVKEAGTLSWLRAGDTNQDGYLDLLVTLSVREKGENIQNVFVLYNEEIDSTHRKFTLRREPKTLLPAEIMASHDLAASYFIDLREDGCLDTILQYKVNTSVHKFDFIQCGEMGDTTFLKVQVFTPHSGSGGQLGEHTQKGTTWGGACVKFEMEAAGYGEKIRAASCQLPAVTHRSFAAPFTLFGLGRSPNFVELVTTGTPRAGQPENVKHNLKQIVPNSRLMILPPPANDFSWYSRLYVTPSALIVQSLIVMSAVCLLLLLVVLLLHFREKKEDRVERQAQSYRFHFDAM